MARHAAFLRLAHVWYERCQIQPGEKVVIATDSGSESRTTEAFFQTALAMGADANLAYFQRPSLPFSDVPEVVEKVMLEADFIHALLSFSWSYSPSRARVIRKIQTTGQGRMTWGGGHPMFLEVPPDERVIERTKRAANMLDAAKKIRITSALGTDMEWRRGDPNKLLMLRHGGDCDRPGRIGSLNGGIAYSADPGSANGVFYLNGGVEPIDSLGTRPWMIEDPVRVEVVGGRIVQIATSTREGQRVSEWFRSFNDSAMYEFVHTNLGLDHRARFGHVEGRLSHSHSAWGGILLAFGRNYNPLFGMEHLAPGHIDLFLKHHNYFVDERQVMENGTYTDASGLA